MPTPFQEQMMRARALVNSKRKFYLPAILTLSTVEYDGGDVEKVESNPAEADPVLSGFLKSIGLGAGSGTKVLGVGSDGIHDLSASVTTKEPWGGTMSLAPGGIVLVNTTWFIGLGVPEAAAELVHIVHHFLRGYLKDNTLSPSAFKLDMDLYEVFQSVVDTCQCIAVNSALIQEGWSLHEHAHTPSKYGFPELKMPGEYVAMMLEHIKKVDGKFTLNGHTIGPTSCCRPPTGFQRRIDPKIPQRSAKSLIDAARATINERRRTGHGGSMVHNPLWNELELQLEERPETVPWEQALGSCVTSTINSYRAGHADFDYTRPSRRVFSNVAQPSLTAADPNIALGWDTSGSMMDPDTMSRVITETKSLMRRLSIPEVRVIQADTEVRSDEFVRVSDLTAPTFKGCGGSHFSDLFRYIDQIQEKKPDIHVFFTDGEIGFDYAPKTTTIFVVINTASRNPGMRWPLLEKHGKVIHVIQSEGVTMMGVPGSPADDEPEEDPEDDDESDDESDGDAN